MQKIFEAQQFFGNFSRLPKSTNVIFLSGTKNFHSKIYVCNLLYRLVFLIVNRSGKWNVTGKLSGSRNGSFRFPVLNDRSQPDPDSNFGPEFFFTFNFNCELKFEGLFLSLCSFVNSSKLSFEKRWLLKNEWKLFLVSFKTSRKFFVSETFDVKNFFPTEAGASNYFLSC